MLCLLLPGRFVLRSSFLGVAITGSARSALWGLKALGALGALFASCIIKYFEGFL
jgi:hypothetical protein